jgi:predicted DNA-binding transcriptional regulator AlpA
MSRRPAVVVPSNVVQPISISELAAELNVKPITIRRWIKTGHLPPPIRLTRERHFWPRAQLESWFAARSGAA